MLIPGLEYRVWPLQAGATSREGMVVDVDGPMFVMIVEGIRTFYHMAAVACVELVDRDAEAKRAEAQGDAIVAGFR